MSDVEQALATQLRNIEARIGCTVPAVRAEIVASGKIKHGEVRSWLMERFGLGYGDANTLAHVARSDDRASSDNENPLAAIYSGKKEHLRPIHDALILRIQPWGDFEIAPKKAYVALRRRKQFAMLGPKNVNRAELGINLKEEIASDRFVAQKPGGMCQYAVALESEEEIDEELLSVLRRAFDAAG